MENTPNRQFSGAIISVIGIGVALATLIIQLNAGTNQRIADLQVTLSKRIDETNRQIAQTREDLSEELRAASLWIDGTNQRIDGTNQRIDQTREALSVDIRITNQRIDGTNQRIDETNRRIDQTRETLSEELQATNLRIDGTNQRIDSLLHPPDKKRTVAGK